MAFYKDGTIAIPNVTGDIVITASAVQQAPQYTNFADPTSPDWLTDVRINSSGGTTEDVGNIVTNYIPCANGDVVRIKGINIQKASFPSGSGAGQPFYDVNKTFISRWHYGYYISNLIDEGNGIYALTLDISSVATGAAYIRLSQSLANGYTANDVIVTINEEIK